MSGPSSIAVVGMSALFPGSQDLRGFWRDIVRAEDRITDVPPTHWLAEDYLAEGPGVQDTTYAARGGFLDPVGFDTMGFGIPPALLDSTDTTQLIALIVARRCLLDAAGGDPGRLPLERTGCVLGVTSGQELLGHMNSRLQHPIWRRALREHGLSEDRVESIVARILEHYTPWKETTFPGVLGNVVAGRIANRLDLGGMNCVTDAACASSLSAIAMACAELQLGHADLMIAGGADTMNDIIMYVCFAQTTALSHTGDVRPFAANGDGTLLAEGFGMVALKRLEDAERDGDRIHGVIHGVGSSSDGRSKSVYAPVAAGQARAIRRAYSRAGFEPSTVALVEAHGTGTVAGDAAEYEGLLEVFGQAPGKGPSCALGSVKSQIGHAKAAAGAAGLIKAILAAREGVLPPTLKVEAPNPRFDPEGPFYLSVRARPWISAKAHPRRAGVSSFGFGGSNYHVALEAPASSQASPRLRHQDVELVVFAADSPAALRDLLPTGPVSLKRLAWETAHRAVSGPVRLALVAESDEELAGHLERARALIDSGTVRAPGGLVYCEEAHSQRVALLFPGQGSQHLFMGDALAMADPRALATWDACEAALPGLADVVFPPHSYAEGASRAQEARLRATRWAQPALGACSAATLSLLTALGLEVDAVAGHSFGELTALHATGALSLDGLMAAARARGEAMELAAAGDGAMCAVRASRDEVEPLLAGSDVVLANHNAPRQVVLSGPTRAIEAIEARLAEAGLAAKRLEVATAFHSPVVAGAASTFADALAGIPLHAPTLPLWCGATARPLDGEVRSSLVQALTAPVRFVELVEGLIEEGITTFVEVGPGSVLRGLASRIAGDRAAVVGLDRRGGGLRALYEGLAELVASGVPLDLARLWDDFSEPEDPATRVAPKLEIPLSGANYKRPYPPGPPPPPEAPASQVEPEASTLAAAAPHPPAPLPVSIPSQNPFQAEPTRPAAAPRSSAMPTSDAAWLAAVTEIHRQATEAHAHLQHALAQAHAAYSQVAIESLRALSGAPVGEASAAPTLPPLPAPSFPPPSPPTLAAPPAPTFTAPPVTPAPTPVGASSAAFATPAPTSYAAPPVAPPPPRAAAPVATTAPPTPPAAAAAPAAELTVESVTAALLAVVADKTGYPEELLDLDQQLEADLGVDSIKRVEILSGLREAVPGLPEVEASQLAELDTLRAIVSHIEGALGASGGGPSTVGKTDRTTREDSLRVVRHGVRLMEALASGLAPELVEVRIQPAEHPLSAPLARHLREAGVVATPSDEMLHEEEALVVLTGLSDDARPGGVARDTFALVQAHAGRGPLFLVSDLGGLLGTGPSTRPWSAGLSGLARTAALEWPAQPVRFVDVDRGGRADDVIARVLAAEILGGGLEPEVGLGRDGRRRIRIAERSEARTERPPPVAPGDVLVATGGARGVTAHCVVALARAYGLKVALVGRTPLDPEPPGLEGATDEPGLLKALMGQAEGRPELASLRQQARRVLAVREIRATLDALAGAGCEARYVQASVTDEAALAAAMAEVRETLGPIRALVHGAGVLQDRLIVDKTPDQVERVIATKVDGLHHLLAATADDALQVVVLFSSLAGWAGNVGQSDYAMANAVLDAVAADLAREVPVVRSLAWGPWEGGMVTPALRKLFAARGVPLIPLAEGAQVVVDELRTEREVPLVLVGPESASLSSSTTPTSRRLVASLSVRDLPWLDAHRVEDDVVVPIAWLARLLSRAVEQVAGRRPIRLDDVQVLAPLSVPDRGAARVVLHVEPRGEGEWAVQITGPTGRPVTRARAGFEPVSPGEAISGADPDASVIAPYAGLLFHGPDLQLLADVRSGPGGASANVHASLRVPPDVAALDAALQLALVHSASFHGGRAIPMAIASVDVPPPGPPAARVRSAGRALDPSMVECDLLAEDAHGGILFRVRGVRTVRRPETGGVDGAR